MLLSYFLCFFYAAFTHLVNHPLILVYPILLALCVLYSRSKLVRLSYAVICFIACTCTVYLQHRYYGSNNVLSDILPSILISVALMIAFPFIIIFNSNILYQSQDELEQKRLSLKSKNEELNSYISSNLQLENFAHLASHELKTPLHNVTNFTSLLKKKAGHKLSSKEKEMMDFVTTEVNKMNELIEDLMEFSVVKNAETKFSQIKINELIDQIIDDYFEESKTVIEKNIDIKTVYGQEDLLKQLFVNLIENAIKFSMDSIGQKVEIIGFENQSSYQFSIIDNGIGIKQEFKERVFLIFKRLHQSEEYSGTGIGLPICKSVVEKHNGRIWIKNNPTGGTIMQFTLSKQ